MGAHIDSLLKECPPWLRVGMIGMLGLGTPVFGIMLAGRLYSGPVLVTAILFVMLLVILTLIERLRKLALPHDLAQVVEGYVEARRKFLGNDEAAKKFAWNAMRTLFATPALYFIMSFEPGLATVPRWMIILAGGISIGFSSVRAFVWSLFIISALGWLAGYLLLGVNFNSPQSRDAFFIGWNMGTIVLSWNWVLAGVFAGPLMISMAVGGSRSIEQAMYLQSLKREESDFEAMIEARRERLRRARSQHSKQADEVDVDEPLRRAESDLRAQVNKAPAQETNEPVRFPRPEDFLKRDGGEMLALEHGDPMRVLGRYSEDLKAIEEIEAAFGRRHDTPGRRAFDRKLLNMSAELKSVMFGSTLPEIVALREYFDSLVRLEQGVAANGIYAGVVPVPLGDLDGAGSVSAALASNLAFMEGGQANSDAGAQAGADDDGDDLDLSSGLSSEAFQDVFGVTNSNLGSDSAEDGEPEPASAPDPENEGETESEDDNGETPQQADGSSSAQRRLTATLAAQAAEENADAVQGGSDEEAGKETEEVPGGKDDTVNTSEGSGPEDLVGMLEQVRGKAEERMNEIEGVPSDVDATVPLGSTDEIDAHMETEDSPDGSDDAVEPVDAGAANDEADADEYPEDEVSDEAVEDAPAEHGDAPGVTDESDESGEAAIEDSLVDAATMQLLMRGRVATGLVIREDRRFCDAAFLIGLGSGAVMARGLAERVSGWFDAYEVERDLLAALEFGEVDQAFAKDMIGEVVGKGWIFSRRIGELAGLAGPFRDEVDETPCDAEDAGESATVDEPQEAVNEPEAEQPVEAPAEVVEATSEVEIALVVETMAPRAAEEDEIVCAVSAAALEDAPAEPAAAEEVVAEAPEAAAVDLRGLGIRILAGSYDDELLDTAPNHFDSLESFAGALGLPEAAVVSQYEQFLRISRARAVHVAALAALEKGDVARVEGLLERRAEFEGYEHPDVSIEALETWVKGQKAVENLMARGSAAAFPGVLDKLDVNRRMFIMKRCGLYQHKDVLSLIDIDLPKSLTVLSGLLQVVSITGPNIDGPMALVIASALRDVRKVVSDIMEATKAAKIEPREYVDIFVPPLSSASDVGGWALLEALLQDPPAIDLGFDWAALGLDQGQSGRREQTAKDAGKERSGFDKKVAVNDAAGADALQEEALNQMRKSALDIPVDARRTYEQVCALDVEKELAELDVSRPVFPAFDEVQRSARMTFQGLFSDRVDSMLKVENSSKQMVLRVQLEDTRSQALGHVMCVYLPVTAPQPVWCDVAGDKAYVLRVKDGNREVTARDLEAMRSVIRGSLNNGVGDPDLCLAVVYMSPYLSQDGETSFQPITEEFKGRFRILRSGGDGKLSMNALREYVSGIRLLASSGGSENIFGKNASVPVPVMSVKE